MSPAEAAVTIDILLTADHGCPSCVGEILSRFAERFPEHTALAEAAWGGKLPGYYKPDEEDEADAAEPLVK